MKELSIEEKAKRYDEAIERAKLYKGLQAEMEFIFPELKESESEKIRKLLIGGLELHGNEIFAQGELDMILAWLEKQGEQKPSEWHREDEQNLNACLDYIPDEFLRRWLTDIIHVKYGKPTDKLEPKFKVGDWITDGSITIQIEAIKNNCYLYCGDCYLYSIKNADKVYHLWTVQDAKDGDVLLSPSTPEGDKECPFIFKEIDKNGIVRFHAALLQNEELKIADEITNVIGYANAKYHIPATKEQCDLLFEKMEEAGYMWDDKNKEVQKIKQKPTNNQFTPEQADVLDKHIDKFLEQKQNTSTQINNPSEYINDMGGNGCYLKNTVQSSAWSDEDENIRQWIISDINKLLALKKKSFIIADKEINWLKSLKELHTWKPSDEQMKGIECTIKTLKYQLNAGDERLNSLYQDLKKLREK